MYLAAILGFFVLTTPSALVLSPTQILLLAQDGQPPAPESQETSPAGVAQEPPAPGGEPKSEAPPPKTTPAPDATPQAPKTQPETPAKTPESKTPEPKTKTAAKKRRRAKHTATAMPGAAPEKKVVRNGGTTDPVVQLAPGMSAEQASSQRQSTTQLLATTDANLKQISTRQLGQTQQDSVSQIRKYMEQAKAAEAAGDVERAHNLASKALLLSDDLVKH
jgi:outer membrane biosynthesis protein TonB